MTLTTQSELENTRNKLSRLEARYEALRVGHSNDAVLRQASLLSLKRYINQFKEEIARYETVHQH